MNRVQDKEDRKARRSRRKKRGLIIGISAGLLLGLAGVAILFILYARFEWWAPPLFVTASLTVLASWLLIDGVRKKQSLLGPVSYFLFFTGFSGILWIPFGTDHLDILIPIVSLGIYCLLAGILCGRVAAISEASYIVKGSEIKYFWLLIIIGIVSLGLCLWIEWRNLDPISTLFLVTVTSVPLVLGLSGFALHRISQKSRNGRRAH